MKKIKVLFDKDTLDKRLKSGWGLSFLIDENVLFDTGENGKYLLRNMEVLSVNIEKIEKTVEIKNRIKYNVNIKLAIENLVFTLC